MRRLLVALTLVVIAGTACSDEQAVPQGLAEPGAVRPPAPGAVDHEGNLVDADRFNPTLDGPCRGRLGPTVDGERYLVFFGCGEEIAAVPRSLEPGSEPSRQALDALIAGPTEAEREAGYESLFGPATASLAYTFALEDDIAVVNLSAAFLDVEFLFVPVRTFAELVSTVGALEGVRRVAVLVEGEPLCTVLEEC